MASVLKVDKLDPQSGTALEIGSSGDTITIPSGATFTQSGTMNASAITAGTVATARLGSGTASSSTFLRGDQTYAAPGGVALTGSTNNTLVSVTGADAIAGEADLTFDGALLEVTGSAPIARVNSTAHAYIDIKSGNSSTAGIYFGDQDDGYQGRIHYWTDSRMVFYANNVLSMIIDSTGAVTNEVQPAFCAYNNASQDNIAGGTTISFDTEVFDQGADYNNSTYTFTAPVTGRYCLIFAVRILNLPSNLSWVYVRTGTSNANYDTAIWDTRVFDAEASYWHFNQTIFTDMDASDTSTISYQSAGESVTADIAGGRPQTQFSGYLVC